MPGGYLNPEFSASLDQLLEQLPGFSKGEGYRSPERQGSLYAQGRGAPGRVVTYARPWGSYHQYGAAVDLVPPQGMPESQARAMLVKALADNPDLGIHALGAWDPFHVQMARPLGTLERPTAEQIAAGAPAVTASGSPPGLPVQARDIPEALAPVATGGPRPSLAYGALGAAAGDPYTRFMLQAALGGRESRLAGIDEAISSLMEGVQPAVFTPAGSRRA